MYTHYNFSEMIDSSFGFDTEGWQVEQCRKQILRSKH